MVKPLFVLGKQRSGTTWLSNQLCQHPLISGIKHEHHKGIHESAYFSHVYGRYGDLKQKKNFIEFVEVMAASDTFRLLGVDKDFLYSLFPTTYEELFQTVMSRYAQRQGARYWLDKTPEHTLLVHKLAAIYPDAKFIAIIRNVEDVMRSTVGRYGRIKRRQLVVAKGTLGWVRFNNAIKDFAKNSDRIYVTRYETLRSDTENVLREMCEFLELEFEAAMLKEVFKRNSLENAARNREREKILSSGDKRLINWTAKLGQLLPPRVLNEAKFLHAKAEDRRDLPSWFFSMYPPHQAMKDTETDQPEDGAVVTRLSTDALRS